MIVCADYEQKLAQFKEQERRADAEIERQVNEMLEYASRRPVLRQSA